MHCSACNGSAVSFDVPEELRAYAPDETDTAAFCTRCLRVEPSETGGSPDFTLISDEFPADADSAIPLALAIGQLGSLALNRRRIEALIERVEKNGTDALLVLDRLNAQGNTAPHFDVPRRRAQLEQLRE
ncbi:DUF6276 family protein [Natronomonas sp. EA1]|uniref:DUF6276 family protein n=1 Tax=Natronomonas sp. EA1 TaxID=3421655 RepID=UPI003EBBC5E4